MSNCCVLMSQAIWCCIQRVPANVLHRQETVDHVSQWMFANLLSLNQFKTEFLLIGLPAQLPKISDLFLLVPSNAIITQTSSARNLGVIFDSTLFKSDHICSVSIHPWPSQNREHSWQHHCAHYRHISHPFKTRLLQFSFSQPFPYSLNVIVFSSFSTLPLEQFLNLTNSATAITYIVKSLY